MNEDSQKYIRILHSCLFKVLSYRHHMLF